MKKLLCVLLALMLVLALAACNSSSGNKGNEGGGAASDDVPAGTFTMWAWDEEALTGCMDELNKTYPDIHCEYLNVPNEEILQKMQTTIASGMELPDLFWSDGANRGKFQTMGILQNLEELGFNPDDIFDFLKPLAVDQDGHFVAIPSNCAISGMSYNRNLAKEYLGTDDDKELEAMFPDWDSFIAKGDEVFEKSGGKVHLLAGATDAYQILFLQNDVSYVSGTELDYTNAVEPTLKTIFDMRDHNVFGDMDIWSTAWSDSYAAETVIFYPCATWSVRWQNETFSEPNGQWGLMKAPERSFIWGGANWVITKDSEEKDAAWAYVKWFSLSEEGAYYMQENCSWYTPYKKMYEGDNLDKYASNKSDWFGDQDIGLKMWNELAKDTISMRQVGAYDAMIDEVVQLILKSCQSDASFTFDQARGTFETELGSRDSSLTVK